MRQNAGFLVAQGDLLHALRFWQLGEERLQVVENVAGAHHELGALLNQTIGSHRTRRVNVPRDSINGAALLDRL